MNVHYAMDVLGCSKPTATCTLHRYSGVTLFKLTNSFEVVLVRRLDTHLVVYIGILYQEVCSSLLDEL